MSRLFDTLEQATKLATDLKIMGAQGKEIFEEYDYKTIHDYINKIKATKFNLEEGNIVKFLDIFEWQNATIDSGLEVYEHSGNFYFAKLPDNLFKALIATVTNYEASPAEIPFQIPEIVENVFGKYLVVRDIENGKDFGGSRGYIYNEFCTKS